MAEFGQTMFFFTCRRLTCTAPLASPGSSPSSSGSWSPSWSLSSSWSASAASGPPPTRSCSRRRSWASPGPTYSILHYSSTTRYTKKIPLVVQCSGSMTFWCGSGSGDPCLWLMDPDLDPDLDLFVIDLQDANKKLPIKKNLLITFWRYIYILFER